MRLCTLFVLSCVTAYSAAPDTTPLLDRKFTQVVRPFITKNCVGCHSGTTPAASLDLKNYTTLESVKKDYFRWVTVSDRLTAQTMPPKPMPEPPADLRQQVIDWIAAVRADEVRKHGSDPGPVLARRLSNAEYNYTIRDLTGVDLQPTREFPVDPANTAGFDNSGESLTMSPALLKKYLDAAREVADHMVLTPDGFDFSPKPALVETDRELYAIQRIVNFYKSQPTDYADYFDAAWRYKNRVALGKPKASLESIATESKISPKYLPLVWGILEEQKDALGPIAKLQAMWKALPTPENGGDGKEPEALHKQTVAMRDFVVRIREHTAKTFLAPKMKGLDPTSQPLMNWKLRQFNANRRNFDPATLRNAEDPTPAPPTIPRQGGLGQEAGNRWALIALKNRLPDMDLVVPKAERAQYEAAFARFANVFPDVFYVSERGRFFPDDSEDKGRLLSAGYHNVMGYWRDDQPLQELILDEAGKKQLERLWTEFDFVGDYTIHTWTQYFFNQSGEIRIRNRESGTERPKDKEITDPSVIFGLMKEYLAKADAPGNDPACIDAIKLHFNWVNDTIQGVLKLRAEAEPKHMDTLLQFAAKAYRRPLTRAEKDDLLAYYHTLRDKNGLSHEEAMRISVVGILMSPDFTYRIDLAPTVSQTKAPVSTTPKPLPSTALASRLSYFLWSTMPDQELMAHAAKGDLQNPEVLTAQVRRMLKDPRAHDFATEFAGNWLGSRGFQTVASVDRERFPEFTNELRDAMFEEPIRYVEDLLNRNGSVLDLIYGNYTFVNPVLAKHYGMPEVKGENNHWVKVENAGQYQRGGILPMSVFLTQNSPGLRTSPVKRGYWVVHRVLGETIPPPPPVVPELPHDEARMDLPVRATLAKHRENPVCAGCHIRFDSFGLAFENYGPVGNSRKVDLAGRPVDTKVNFPNGTEGNGFESVQAFIRDHKQAEFVDGLSRKMLSYALNRSLQLSDEAVIAKMNSRLAANGYKIGAMVETIVTSPQFLTKRAPEVKISTSVSVPGSTSGKGEKKSE